MSNARNIADSNLDDLIVDNIYLGGTGSANQLDDYEEGTWTPTITDGTIDYTSAEYIKIGQLVTVTGVVHTISNRTSNNHVTVGGLPFSTGSTAIAIGATLARYINSSGDSVLTYIGTSRSYLNFYSANQGTIYDIVRHSDLNSASANFHFTITYIAA